MAALLHHRINIRFTWLAALALFFILVNALTRVALHLAFSENLPFSTELFTSLLPGVANDLAALAFVLPLPALALLLPGDAFLKRSAGKVWVRGTFFVVCGVMVFTAFAEFFFWEEFGSRFNFIAVDYLIYTKELANNALESYPLAWLLAAVFLLAAGAAHGMAKYCERSGSGKECTSTFRVRFSVCAALCAVMIAVFAFFTPLQAGNNRYWNEFAKNGMYELFSAYRNNQLDYRAFYPTMETRDAFALMRSQIPDSGIFEARGNQSLVRMVTSSSPERMPNVIVVVMESMGSRWFGDEFTPNLHQLAKEGLSFTNMMSTGTRTVRGIEAIMLSVPPTPGNSIVRRPGNDKLFTLGTMFREHGYDLSFIYGGIGFFDNMNAFFEGNGYTVTDKLGFDTQNKTFANAWGQCDEDLYSQSLALADKSYRNGKPFHQVLLTTSNHRPFTWPEGKEGMGQITQSQGTRRGAVQYADYAIGAFMEQAREKPWFDDTVFLFVGDHPSSIAGKAELPADAYGIVSIMYGPRFFKPERVDTLSSQIDIAPTLFASLGWGYLSPFFGSDARTLPAESGRAWISTYQLLGYLTNDRLAILTPDGSGTVNHLQEQSTPFLPQDDENVLKNAVASYQTAYDLFTNNRMKEYAVFDMRVRQATNAQPAASPAPRERSLATGRENSVPVSTNRTGTAYSPGVLRKPG